MIRVLVQSLRAVLVLTVLTGAIYPLAVTAVARIAFKDARLGSRIYDESGTLRGSSLIGQSFSRPEYFWPRRSASNYDPLASGGTSFSPVGSAAIAQARTERARLLAANPEAKGEPPLLLLTASGSGLDPHLSPEAARWQAPRIARARGIDATRVRALIEEEDFRDGPRYGLGEPCVNVLKLNMALDSRFKMP